MCVYVRVYIFVCVRSSFIFFIFWRREGGTMLRMLLRLAYATATAGNVACATYALCFV